MKKSIIFLLIVLGCSQSIEANDTTTLYKKRLHKIRELSEWLSKRPYEKINVYESDTSSRLWITYDTAITLFFNRQMMDSLYENRGRQNDIFSKSAKFQLLKQLISGFHHLTIRQCFDSLKFRSKGDYITQYLLIDNKEYIINGFGFLHDSDQLLGMPLPGMPEPEHQVVRSYYERLKPCNKATR